MEDSNTVTHMEICLYSKWGTPITKWYIPSPSKAFISELNNLLSRNDEPCGATSANTQQQINDLESVVLSQGKAIGALQALIEKQNAILDDAAASVQSLCRIAEAHQNQLDEHQILIDIHDDSIKRGVDGWFNKIDDLKQRLDRHAEMLHIIKQLLDKPTVINVTVQGSVSHDKDLIERVRKALIEQQRRNGSN